MFVDVFCTDTFNTNTNISDTLSILLRIKYKAFNFTYVNSST